MAPASPHGWMYSPCISTLWAIHAFCHVPGHTGLHRAACMEQPVHAWCSQAMAGALKASLLLSKHPCCSQAMAGARHARGTEVSRMEATTANNIQFHSCKEPKGWGKGLQGAHLGLCLSWESNPALPLQSEEGVHALLVDSGCYFIQQ